MVGLITAIILIPLLGAAAVCVWPPTSAGAATGRLRNGRVIALMFTIISAGCAVALWRNFDVTATRLQFVERHAWIPAKPAARIAHVADYSIRTARTTGSRRKPRVLRDDLDHAVCALRDVHRSEFRCLVSVLRNESGSGLFVDKNLGRRKPRSRRNQIFPVHISRKRIHVAFVPWDLLGQRYVRLRRSGESWEDRLALRKSRVGRVCRNFSWVCGQGAAVSVSHLAARRLPNCAYRRVDGANRCAIKNGRLRIRAPVASIVP